MRWNTLLRVVIVGVVIVGGYFAYRQCSSQESDTALESVVQEEEIIPVISVSGTVLPSRWANLSFVLGGRVERLCVDVGQNVVSGQLLARLDSAELQSAAAQAEAGLAVAQATLAQVKAGARSEEVAAAESAVAAAEANLAAARAELDSAEAGLAQLVAGVSERELELARLAVEQANNNLWGAQGQRDAIAGSQNPLIRPGDVAAAKAAVRNAEVTVRMAEVEYERLKTGAGSEEITMAQAQVDGARSRIEAAQAQASQARSQLALLRAGPGTEAVAVAEAQVELARTALNTAQVALTRAKVHAPFSGTVGAVLVREGELVMAGQPLVTLGDLSTLRVETSDLDEIDVARVAVGQRASLTFDALPERTLGGTVTRIAPMARPGAGGVNYTAIVELDEIEPVILWGMTAFADIEVER